MILLLACAPSGPWSATGLPSVAPGATLLATLDAEDQVSVGGSSLGELWVDVDQGEDERYAFRYVMLDEGGAELYARSTPGPLIVREFLAYYEDDAGFDMLEAFPLLGNFPVTIPLLDDAASVRFDLRDDDGIYQEAGRYDLATLEADDQGPLASVTGGETLHESGPSDNRLDIVLLGDGYTEAEQATWREDADTLAAAILAEPPLADFADRINLHRVDAVSAESGVSYDCVDECRMRDTAYQSVFPIEFANAVLGSNYRTTAIFQLDQWGVARAAASFPWDMVVVVANTSHDGGFAVHYATVPKGPTDGWPSTGVHELGHTLGLLGDEYMSDACVRSGALGLPDNIAEDPEAPPWSAWIEADTPLPTPDESAWRGVVGAFEEAWNCEDLYRPERRCVMRGDPSAGFCAVCGELLTRRIFRFGDPADGVSEADGTFTLGGRIDGATVRWLLDGELVAEDVDQFGPTGGGELRVEVELQTDRVREDQGDLVESWSFRRE